MRRTCRCDVSASRCERHLAEELGIAEITLRRMRERREVTFHRFGSSVRYLPEHVEEIKRTHAVSRR